MGLKEFLESHKEGIVGGVVGGAVFYLLEELGKRLYQIAIEKYRSHEEARLKRIAEMVYEKMER
jgi:hypothetical protein